MGGGARTPRRRGRLLRGRRAQVEAPCTTPIYLATKAAGVTAAAGAPPATLVAPLPELRELAFAADFRRLRGPPSRGRAAPRRGELRAQSRDLDEPDAGAPSSLSLSLSLAEELAAAAAGALASDPTRIDSDSTALRGRGGGDRRRCWRRAAVRETCTCPCCGSRRACRRRRRQHRVRRRWRRACIFMHFANYVIVDEYTVSNPPLRTAMGGVLQVQGGATGWCGYSLAKERHTRIHCRIHKSVGKAALCAGRMGRGRARGDARPSPSTSCRASRPASSSAPTTSGPASPGPAWAPRSRRSCPSSSARRRT